MDSLMVSDFMSSSSGPVCIGTGRLNLDIGSTFEWT